MNLIRNTVKSLKAASWLGWQMEANWTDPYLFAIYSFAKPISSALILVVMYFVVIGTPKEVGAKSGFFLYMYVGNAFYMFVTNVLFGISWVILDDREHYEMLKYIYLSPVRIYLYLFGRGMAKLSITAVAVVITLAFGIIFFKLPLNPLKVDYPLLLIALFTGLIGIVGLGIILAGISLLVAKHGFFMNEGVAGIFYLVCGAIFPVEVLPGWLQAISKCLPFTYWLEGIRRATIGKSLSPSLEIYSTGNILLILVVTTVLLGFLSHWTFTLCEYVARKKGLIDRTTGY